MSINRAPVQETSFDLEQQDALIRTHLNRSLASLNSVVINQGFCDSCLTRIPYATLIATIQCALGVVVFCGSMYRGGTLAVLMFNDVFRMQLFWVDAVKMTFVIIGACMGALGLMILTVGCLATGDTRHKVYRQWGSRVGGRISCAIFIGITYILQLVWMVIFVFLVIATFLFTIFWKMCSDENVANFRTCVDFTQFHFLFPNGHKQEHMKACSEKDIKAFCKDYTEKIEVMVILATVAAALVILSLVHYLMCLTANYAHIRDHEKFQELQDLQVLSDNDVLSGKDRF